MNTDRVIRIAGIKTNNLKNITVKIKKNALNLIIGPSGSGKSSLAYETIAQLGMHEYLSMFTDPITETRYKVDSYENMTVTVPIKQNNANSNVKSTIGTYFGLSGKISSLFAAILNIDDDFFVLNKEENVCPQCHGLGYVKKLDENRIVDFTKSLKNNPFRCWERYSDFYNQIIRKFCNDENIDINKTFDELSEGEKALLLTGISEKKYQIYYKHGNSKSSRTTKFYGVMTEIPMRLNYKPADRFYSDVECTTCKGRKYSSEHDSYKIANLSIGEFMVLPFNELQGFLERLYKMEESEQVRHYILSCKRFVDKAIELNLGHLYFNRSIPSLSGGELQRLRLVQLFISQLADLTIILDEPMAGLSKAERETVFNNIILLSKKHTLIVVDHSSLFVNHADNIIALGEGSGVYGGTLINPKTYLDKQNNLPTIIPQKACEIETTTMRGDVYLFSGARITYSAHSLNLISGPSGIGKSTLMREYFPRSFEEYEYVNQKPIHGNQNSNVATLLHLASPIFKIFSEKFNMEKDFFSNASGKLGACKMCEGAGHIQYGSMILECGECGGTGFNSNLRKYKIDGKNLNDIWNMTLTEAVDFFGGKSKSISRVLKSACEIALGHLKLGQLTKSLSGGENVRIKLLDIDNSDASVLGIDEPFKGLNPQEVYLIMTYLTKMRDCKEKTIFVVDHTDFVEEWFDYHIELSVKNNILIGG